MPEIQVNLLSRQADKHPVKQRPRWPKIILIAAILLIFGLAVFASALIFSDNGLASNLSKMNLFKQFGQLITSANKDLTGEKGDRINVLLIGMGGQNHEGGTLADTIILASFKPSTKQVALLSLPRDMNVPYSGYGWIKINAVNAYAEKKETGSGGEAMTKLLGQLLGEDIPYYATVDFDGFEQIIDDFGGVDVEVARDLIDYQYPIRGNEDIFPLSARYETLKITKGWQHLDGALALKYARSRHALGAEGSDFARAQRQQKILTALKDKIINTDTLTSPQKINSLLSAYNEHASTNLQLWEMVRLAQLGQGLDASQIINKQLSDASDGLLYSAMVNGSYVLLPVGGNFEAIASLWQNIFNSDQAAIEIKNSPLPGLPQADKPVETAASSTATMASSTPTTADEESGATETFTAEHATVEILNGTFIAGWAGQEKAELSGLGFTVNRVGNAPARDYKQIYIYDLSGGQKPLTAKELAKIYSNATLATGLPSGLTSNADFLIVLGK